MTLVLNRRRPRATGELDFLLPHVGFAEIARQLALRAPQLYPEGRVSSPAGCREPTAAAYWERPRHPETVFLAILEIAFIVLTRCGAQDIHTRVAISALHQI